MKLRSISQIPLVDTDRVITEVVIQDVTSHCILVRQLIDGLGRPGVDTDMEMVGADSTWTLVWTQPQMTLEQATCLVKQAIAPQP